MPDIVVDIEVVKVAGMVVDMHVNIEVDKVVHEVGYI